MKISHSKKLIAVTFASLVSSTAVVAEEGGTGHYAIGGVATMIDLAPTDPGWLVQPLYLNYEGSASKTKALPIANQLALDVDAKVDALTLGAMYTFEEPVLGAMFTIGAYVPYVDMEISAEVAIGDGLNTRTKTDQVSGVGDITIIPAVFAWKTGNWQTSLLLPVYAPTGDYELGRLANQGLNYWTFDPTVGVAYGNPETGFNFGLYGGVTFNTENSATNYDSGSVMHIESSVQQLLPLGSGYAGVGLNAFVYQQISADSGEGAVLGDFKGRSLGIGPVLSYVLPTESGTGVVELRWLPELDTDKRLEGDYVWLKAVWQF